MRLFTLKPARPIQGEITRSYLVLALGCALAGVAHAQFVQQGGKLAGSGAVGGASGPVDSPARPAQVFIAQPAIAAAPTVSTSPVPLPTISGNSGTLAGTVNPNGLDTHVWFLYGNSNPLFQPWSTPQQDIGSGTAAVSLTASLTGLFMTDTYYYQAVAQNSAGTVMGSVLSFSTIKTRPTVATLIATSVTSSSARLFGSVNQIAETGTQVWFQYSTSSSMSNALSTPHQTYPGYEAFWADLTSLSANTVYPVHGLRVQ